MKRLTIVLAVAAALCAVAGCEAEGDEGSLCNADEDCNSGLVCVSQVWNCPGSDCWGACERECDHGTDCDVGDVCVVVTGGARVCRPANYDDPLGG